MVDNGPDMSEWMLGAVTDKGVNGTDIVIVDDQLSVVCMPNHCENTVAV